MAAASFGSLNSGPGGKYPSHPGWLSNPSPGSRRNLIREVPDSHVHTLSMGIPAKMVSISFGSGCTSSQIAFHPGSRTNVCSARLDAAADPWAAAGAFDAVVCCNVMHIAPWAVAEGILRGSAAAGATLFAYGPFAVDGAHVSESNEAFDARLRAQDEAWGVRDTADVAARAEAHGYALADVVPMPANNRLLVFTR